MRQSDDLLGGEPGNKYHSNNVLEAFAISMAAVYVGEENQIILKYANSDFYRMIGWSRVDFKELFNECLNDDIIFPDDFEAFHRTVTSLNEEHPEAVFECRVSNMSGSVTVNEVRASFLERENERPLISMIFYDITERTRLRRDLLIQNERFNIIRQSTDHTIFDYDTEKDVLLLIGTVSRIEKYLSVYRHSLGTNEIVIDDFFNGRFALNFMNREDYRSICDAFADAIVNGAGGELDFQACVIGQTSGTWFRCTFSPVCDNMGSVIRLVGRLKNIDKQKKAEQLMEKRMRSDQLTGLLNKETAKHTIRELLDSQGRPDPQCEKYHVLMILDLDNFHLINECFGHTFGDNVLKEFAADIKSSFRDTDIVSRLVGDRFMVLMKDVTQKFAVKKAGRLCRSLIKSYGVKNAIEISCSIGVALFGKDAFNFDTLYQFADRAVYEAKKNGKKAYFFYDSDLQEDYSMVKELGQNHVDDMAPMSDEKNELDSNLMDIAFSLLSASGDLYGNLDILLRTVGRKYNLSAASLYVKGYHPGERLKAVCQWVSNRNLPTRDGRSPLVINHVDLDSELGSAGVRCISDISTSMLQPSLKNMLQNDGMNALVICALEGRAGENFGYLVLTQFDRKRKWSNKETNTFRYLSKILSLALAQIYDDHRLESKAVD